MDIKNWIFNWFIQNKEIPENDLSKNMEENYFEQGFIDSLAFVTLLVDIESELGISLENEDFVEGKFFTLKGAIEILERNANE